MPADRILLVEDEATTRELLTHVLIAAGYAVDAVASATAAAMQFGSVPYSLVIADWILPDGNGIDIADHAADAGSKMRPSDLSRPRQIVCPSVDAL